MGTLTFQATAGGSVNLLGPNISGTVNLTLPSADGTSGQPLQTNGSGTLSFANLAIANGGTGVTSFAANQIHYGSFSQSANLTFNGTTLTANTLNLTNALGTAYGGTGLTSFTANGVVYASSTSALATGSALTFDGTNMGMGASSPTAIYGKTLQIASGTTEGSLSIVGSTGNGYVATVGAVFAVAGRGGMALTLGTNDVERMRIDSSGNLGLGVTPSAWGSIWKAQQFQVGGFIASQTNANDIIHIGTNAFANTSNAWTYINSTFSTRYQQYQGAHSWYNAPSGTAGNAITFTQAMTLDSSGNLLVGTTSTSVTSGGLYVRATSSGGTSLIIGHQSGVATGNSFAEFQYAGNLIGSITQSGTTATLFNVTSDQRLKENIQDADSASSLIDSLQVRKFDWKTDNTHQRYGFVAQELVTVAPEAVHQPADTEAMMAVDYSKLVPMLVKEIQSLRKRLSDAGIA